MERTATPTRRGVSQVEDSLQRDERPASPPLSPVQFYLDSCKDARNPLKHSEGIKMFLSSDGLQRLHRCPKLQIETSAKKNCDGRRDGEIEKMLQRYWQEYQNESWNENNNVFKPQSSLDKFAFKKNAPIAMWHLSQTLNLAESDLKSSCGFYNGVTIN